MIQLQMSVIGMKALNSKLRKTGNVRTGRHPAMKAIAKAAYTFERQVKKWSPVDTGRMRSSITTHVNNPAMFAQVMTNVRYAPFVELSGGTPRGVGRIPFWDPSWKAVQGKIRKYMAEAAAAMGREWRN